MLGNQWWVLSAKDSLTGASPESAEEKERPSFCRLLGVHLLLLDCFKHLFSIFIQFNVFAFLVLHLLIEQINIDNAPYCFVYIFWNCCGVNASSSQISSLLYLSIYFE